MKSSKVQDEPKLSVWGVLGLGSGEPSVWRVGER